MKTPKHIPHPALTYPKPNTATEKQKKTKNKNKNKNKNKKTPTEQNQNPKPKLRRTKRYGNQIMKQFTQNPNHIAIIHKKNRTNTAKIQRFLTFLLRSVGIWPCLSLLSPRPNTPPTTFMRFSTPYTDSPSCLRVAVINRHTFLFLPCFLSPFFVFSLF